MTDSNLKKGLCQKMVPLVEDVIFDKKSLSNLRTENRRVEKSSMLAMERMESFRRDSCFSTEKRPNIPLYTDMAAILEIVNKESEIPLPISRYLQIGNK